MTPATIVAGGSYCAREARIAELLLALPAPAAAAVILEGMPDGLDRIGEACRSAGIALPRIVRLPPGCPCCAGKLVVRVTLNRLLRPRPSHLFFGIADATHRAALRDFLLQPPYGELLAPDDDIVL